MFVRRLFYTLIPVLILSLFAILNTNASDSRNPFASKFKFPIPELGNCASQEECRVYCDDPLHIDACISFAEKNNLISKEDSSLAKKIRTQGGPGGCKTETECKTYCADPANADECAKFAQDNNIGGETQLKIAKILLEKPGPGGCISINTCKAYCSVQDHQSECLKFAQDNNLISKDEVAKVKKLNSKPGPGGCLGEACRIYCQNPDHQAGCLKFAVDNGFIKKEDADRALKLKNIIGPGGCQGEKCKEYCDDQDHQTECLKFAQDNNLIPSADLQKIKAQHTKFANDLRTRIPERVRNCLIDKFGSDFIQKIENGQTNFDSNLTSQMKTCFQEFGQTSSVSGEPYHPPRPPQPSGSIPPMPMIYRRSSSSYIPHEEPYQTPPINYQKEYQYQQTHPYQPPTYYQKLPTYQQFSPIPMPNSEQNIRPSSSPEPSSFFGKSAGFILNSFSRFFK